MVNRGNPRNVRRCEICGEPIYSRATVHPECAEQAGESRKLHEPPQKICSACGEKSHVRKQVCDNCGTMF